jgi:putative tryptophan/tyrosine transport system substrate-binding protein
VAGLKANASASKLRAAQGQLHLLPEFAAEMVNLGVNLIAVIGAVTVRAVRQATSTIPIVFAVVVEPIATDWPRT